MKNVSMKPKLRFFAGEWWCSLERVPDHCPYIAIAHPKPVIAYQAWVVAMRREGMLK